MFEALESGTIAEYYDAQVVSDAELEEGTPSGRLVVDTRLRDALRRIAAGETRLEFPTPTLVDEATYAVEAAVLGEADVVRLQRRLDTLEQRLATVEHGLPNRVYRKLAGPAKRVLRRGQNLACREARHDAPRARRGGHRRCPDRVPPECRRRLRHRDRQPLRGRDDGDPRALRARRTPHLIREPGDDLRQSEWVTRMARLAASELGADWIFNTDADEFWWPLGGGFRGVVRGGAGALRRRPRRVAQLRPEAGRRAVLRRAHDRSLLPPGFHAHPLATHFKSAHRAAPDVRDRARQPRGLRADGLVPLRGWHPIEILHFPVRSLEHCRRKYVTQFVALERNAEKGIPDHMAEAYRAYRAGRLEDFYRPLVVDDDALERGSRPASSRVDTRLRDVLALARLRRRRARRGACRPRSATGRGGCRVRGRVLGPAARPTSVSRSGAQDRRPRVADRRPRAPPVSRAGRAVRERALAVSRFVARLLEFVPTRRAAVVLVRRSRSASSGSRRSAGRWRRAGTRGTTSSTTSSSLDSEPPLSELQVFRTPLTPLVVGLPLDLGGTGLLEVVFGAPVRRPRSSPGARRRSPSAASRRSSRAAPPRLPGVRDALPPGLERRRLRDRARAVGAPSRARAAIGRRPGASSRSAPGSRCSC